MCGKLVLRLLRVFGVCMYLSLCIRYSPEVVFKASIWLVSGLRHNYLMLLVININSVNNINSINNNNSQQQQLTTLNSDNPCQQRQVSMASTLSTGATLNSDKLFLSTGSTLSTASTLSIVTTHNSDIILSMRQQLSTVTNYSSQKHQLCQQHQHSIVTTQQWQ